jgi:hypothetical protein
MATRYIDLTGQVFGKLTVIKLYKNDKSKVLWNCSCECGNNKIASTVSLRRKIRPVKNCGCMTNELKRQHLLLPFGEAHINRLFLQYKNNAKKRNIEFKLDMKIFKVLITSCCSICDSEPKMVKYRKSYKPNGLIPHNGIDRIDNSKGYLIDNVQTMCTDCNRAKSNLTNEDFNIWLDKIVEKALKDKSYLNLRGKKGVAV